jgi:hypothetical protein
MSDKKGLLPIVSDEIGYAIEAELIQGHKDHYYGKLLKRLSEEDNPCIANFISKMSALSTDPGTTTSTALLVYRLLESQAEADRMK